MKLKQVRFDKVYQVLRAAVSVSIAITLLLFLSIFVTMFIEEETYPVGSCPDYPHCSYQ